MPQSFCTAVWKLMWVLSVLSLLLFARRNFIPLCLLSYVLFFWKCLVVPVILLSLCIQTVCDLLRLSVKWTISNVDYSNDWCFEYISSASLQGLTSQKGSSPLLQVPIQTQIPHRCNLVQEGRCISKINPPDCFHSGVPLVPTSCF